MDVPGLEPISVSHILLALFVIGAGTHLHSGLLPLLLLDSSLRLSSCIWSLAVGSWHGFSLRSVIKPILNLFLWTVLREILLDITVPALCLRSLAGNLGFDLCNPRSCFLRSVITDLILMVSLSCPAVPKDFLDLEDCLANCWAFCTKLSRFICVEFNNNGFWSLH